MSKAPIQKEQTYLDLFFDAANIELTVLSYGGGQDSTAILFKLVFDKEFRAKYCPGRLLVVFANTHNEHAYTYHYIDTVIKPFCKEHDIEFVQINNDMGYHGNTWQSLTGQWENNHPTIGSLAYNKSCTHNLKLQPQFRYVRNWLANKFDFVSDTGDYRNYTQFTMVTKRKITWLIGIAREEESRVMSPDAKIEKWRKKSINVVYPLIEIGYNRKDCQEYIESTGYDVPLPSNCMFCPFSCNYLEILWLERNYPEQFSRWVKYETKKLAYYPNVHDFIIDYRTKEFVQECKKSKAKPIVHKVIVDWGENLKMDLLEAMCIKAKELSSENGYVKVNVKTYIENDFIEDYLKNEPCIKKVRVPNHGVSAQIHKTGDKKGEAVDLMDFLAIAKAKYPDITNEQLNDYKSSHGHCVTSKY